MIGARNSFAIFTSTINFDEAKNIFTFASYGFFFVGNNSHVMDARLIQQLSRGSSPTPHPPVLPDVVRRYKLLVTIAIPPSSLSFPPFPPFQKRFTSQKGWRFVQVETQMVVRDFMTHGEADISLPLPHS